MSNQIQGFQLSPQQTRLWLLRQTRRVDPMQCAIMIEGDFDSEKLKEVLQGITDRHEIFRTTFHHRPGIRLPIQVIAERTVPACYTRDLNHEERQTADIESLVEEERCYPFNYEQGPLLRAALLSLSKECNVLLLTAPAFCADARTLRNLFHEICEGFAGRPGNSFEDTTQYVQFSEWQNQLLESEESETGKNYWRRLSTHAFAPLSLALTKQTNGNHEFKSGKLSTTIDPAVLARMEVVANDYDTTISNFLLSCWQILLWWLTGQRDVRVGVGFDGREFEELQDSMGVFTKRLPIDCHCDRDFEFQRILKQVTESMTTACAWQDYFVPEQSESGPVTAMNFEFEEWPVTRQVAGLRLSLAKQYGDGADRYQVKLQCLRRATAELELAWHYDATVLSEVEVKRIAGQFATLVASACREPEACIGELEVVSAAERSQLVEEWNRTAVVYEETGCLAQQFEAQVERTPEATAVVYEGATLSYAELNRRANQVAHYLREQGVGPEAVVGIQLERSLELVVSMLGVLKAGAAYLPLDPGYPAARLQFMVADAGVRVLLTEEWLKADVEATAGCQVVCLTQARGEIARCSGANVASGVEAGNLAYVIYTSGSTGQPKGVMITHGGLTNYLNWCTKAYSVTDKAGTLVHTSVGFDLTVTSLFSPLVVGRSVTILPEELAIDGLSLALDGDSDFSLIKITPAQLDILGKLFTDKNRSSAVNAGALVIGGEALHWSSLSYWRSHHPHVRLINEYGPTETVVGCCVYEVAGNTSGGGVVPIGRPIANTQLYVLDSHLRPVPAGAKGELYIGGHGVARGYLNRPGVTAEKFVPNPFSTEHGARLYRTGDLARFLLSDELEYVGRIDNQVKLRGFRIELGEIEATLKQHAAVEDAAVILREDVPGDARLIAYCVMDQARVDELQAFIREKLPHYMIPAVFITLKALPLTTNGKVDRNALPGPEIYQAQSKSNYAKPRTELEQTIVTLWQDMLRLDRVGIYDNFFDLGGHSMLMVQLHSRLRGALNRDIPIVDLFGHPTIGSLAEYLSQQDDAAVVFRQDQDRAGNRRSSSKRQKQVRQNHRETARTAERLI